MAWGRWQLRLGSAFKSLMDIRKGQRVSLNDLVNAAQPFQIELSIAGVSVDFACFGLDGQHKLANDAYMTFFNQPQTPCGAIELTKKAGSVLFTCQLQQLPSSIDRLVFTAAIDGGQAMRSIHSGTLKFLAAGQITADMAFSGQDFQEEKAIILCELYRKDGAWRFNASLQGFNGGLSALVTHFGADVLDEPVSAPKLSLEKKIAEAAPKLVDLAKKATISLEKHRLEQTVARVCLILDASGSMHAQYNSGKVQALIERLLPLAVHFDDDGELDVWAFSHHPLSLPSANLGNFADYINSAERGWRNWGLMSVNNEPAVIQAVVDYYRGTQLPVLAIFVSDGGVSRNKEIKQQITEASLLPIFWQFVGIGGRNYGVLEKLDTLTGRIVDNCGFFALDDLYSATEQELYDRLLGEFPLWLKAAKQNNVLR